MLSRHQVRKILRDNPDLKALNPELVQDETETRTAPVRADTELEAKFSHHWQLLAPDQPLERDHIFAPHIRRYEIDFYHPPSRVGVEINGGIWTTSGHSSGQGINRDYDKILLAATFGIHILPISSDMLTQSRIVETVNAISQVIRIRGGKDT